jgi:hypothetical protein
MTVVAAMAAMAAFFSPYKCISFFPAYLKMSKCIFNLAYYHP